MTWTNAINQSLQNSDYLSKPEDVFILQHDTVSYASSFVSCLNSQLGINFSQSRFLFLTFWFLTWNTFLLTKW